MKVEKIESRKATETVMNASLSCASASAVVAKSDESK